MEVVGANAPNGESRADGGRPLDDEIGKCVHQVVRRGASHLAQLIASQRADRDWHVPQRPLALGCGDHHRLDSGLTLGGQMQICANSPGRVQRGQPPYAAPDRVCSTLDADDRREAGHLACDPGLLGSVHHGLYVLVGTVASSARPRHEGERSSLPAQAVSTYEPVPIEPPASTGWLALRSAAGISGYPGTRARVAPLRWTKSSRHSPPTTCSWR